MLSILTYIFLDLQTKDLYTTISQGHWLFPLDFPVQVVLEGPCMFEDETKGK